MDYFLRWRRRIPPPSCLLGRAAASLIGGAVPRKGEPAFRWQGGRSPPTPPPPGWILFHCQRLWEEMEGSRVAISRMQPVVFQAAFTWEKRRSRETEEADWGEDQHLEAAGEEFSLKIPQFPGDQCRLRLARLARPPNAAWLAWPMLLASPHSRL